ncbi:MAG: response regulator [Chloroflexi bacterium]|nr:response regulator [Chloroflexota bacterium]
MPSILIVDDDEGMTETLADIFAARRYDVATAVNGESAVARVSDDRFDVVLMDVKMPGIDGVDALLAMKRRTPDLKVIMMTAFTQDDRVARALDAKAVAVLPKPLDLECVLRLVGRVTGARA